ncbi:hypothetical protein RJ55_07143 [Drechmeria coniospora]|nr:hypothetical protein RJ55_07143 [Drechmeria coniospora]
MSSTGAPRPRPRPAHTQGTTRCAYTSDGTRLVTIGSNNTIRLYRTGYDGEPTNIDDCQEQNVAIASGDEFFVVGSEDGTVSLYSFATANFDRFLLRASVPIRDVALSADGKWCAVASDELSVKIVNTTDITRIRHLREHNRAARHVSFDPKGTTAAVSCTDGIVYVYSLSAEEPEMIRRIDGIIGAVEGESEVTTKAVWHPDGRAFAVATPTKDIQVVSKNDWEKQRRFADGHLADITAMAWSPNGALLASASKDGKLLVWETKTQSVVQKLDHANVLDLAWHPTGNMLSFTTSDGEVYIYPDFLSDQFSPMLKMARQPAPFIHDPLSDISGNRGQGVKETEVPSRRRRESLGSLGSFLEGGGYGDEDDFVVDDDGAGYVNGAKRGRDDDDDGLFGEHASKRMHLAKAQLHEPFQPGSTPWRGNRKYLCLNLIGLVWTVDQDAHHTVTVEFYDHGFQRDFHFTDTFLYDKACLNERGTLFSSPPRDGGAACLFYRPHECWTQRADWRIRLPRGEAVTAMSLSESFVTVTTSANYVRVYSLFGVPCRVYRPKSTPTVTCASWRDYVLTMGNGPVDGHGRARLLYTIENVKRDEICQNEDTVALPEGASLKGVFWSDVGVRISAHAFPFSPPRPRLPLLVLVLFSLFFPPFRRKNSYRCVSQDPCIYDSTGTLLTLLHWRRPSRASWVPLLDTKLLARLASGRKSESYFPIAVAGGKFHCIILKGGDQYPYFPRPLLSEFDLAVPLTAPPKERKGKGKGSNGEADDEAMSGDDDDDDDDDDGDAEAAKLEQEFVLKGVQTAQLRDLVDATSGNHSQRSLLSRLELEMDKTLLQMLAVECRQGDDRGMRALEVVELMRDRTGRMMEAAGKVAERYGRTVLGEKIREVGERRVSGMEGDEGDDGF